MVQGKRIGASPYQEITKRKLAHSRGKVEWTITLWIDSVQSARSNEATKCFRLTRNHQADL